MRLNGNIIMAFLTAATFASIAAGDAGQSNREPPASAVGILLSSAQTNYLLGNAVLISVTVTNCSNHSITLPNGSAWIDNQFRFGVEVSVSNANHVVFGPVTIPGAGVMPQERDFARLAVGNALSVGFDLSDFVPYSAGAKDLRPIGKRPGAYTVRVRLVNRHTGWVTSSDRGPVLKKIDDMWIGESEWAALVIFVKDNQDSMHNKAPEDTARKLADPQR